MTNELEQITKHIREREPIFHNLELTNDLESLEKEIHKDFFEISGSGKYFTREFVIETLLERYKNNTVDVMEKENWNIVDFQVRQLSEDLYMASYILEGQMYEGKPRSTRRTTLWKGNLEDGFQILFHQGTTIQ